MGEERKGDATNRRQAQLHRQSALLQFFGYRLQAAVITTKVNPEVLPHRARTHRNERPTRAVEKTRISQHMNRQGLGEYADRGVEQHQPQERRDSDRRGDGGGEDGAERSEGLQRFVGQDGERGAEHQTGRNHDEDELHGDPHGVVQLARLQHIGVLTETDVDLVTTERVLLVQAEPGRARERVEDEQAEQHEGGEEEAGGQESLTAPAAAQQ